MKSNLTLILAFFLSISLHNITLAKFDAIQKQDTSSIDTSVSECIPVECERVAKEIDVKVESIDQNSNISEVEWMKYALPILTLFLGVFLNRGLEYWSNKRRLKKVLKRWAAEIRSLEKPMKNQIKSLEKFIDDHSEETFEFPKPVVYSILDCSIFNSLDKGELMSAIQNAKGSNYDAAVSISNSINGFISIQIYTYEVLKEKFNDYKDESSKHINSFSESLQGLMRANAELGVEIEKETGKDPANNPNYRAILDLFSVHIIPRMQDGKFNPFEMDRSFFQPLMSVLSEMRLDERIRPITAYASSCVTNIQKLRMERVYVIENMTNVISNYRSQIDDLKKVVEKIEVDK